MNLVPSIWGRTLLQRRTWSQAFFLRIPEKEEEIEVNENPGRRGGEKVPA